MAAFFRSLNNQRILSDQHPTLGSSVAKRDYLHSKIPTQNDGLTGSCLVERILGYLSVSSGGSRVKRIIGHAIKERLRSGG